MIAVIDYGAGNLHSVARALRHVGAKIKVTSSASDIASASGIVLPGVGAAADTMRGLQHTHVTDALLDVIHAGTPFMGVCMGLEVLYESSDEDGGTPCLGVLRGRVVRFPDGLHVPHMGWNQVHQEIDSPLFDGISQDANFYFVHSYYVEPADPDVVLTTTRYAGVEYVSSLSKGNIFACQFHPERSGRSGLRLYRNLAATIRRSA